MLALINDSISEILDKQNDQKVTAKVTVNQQKIINTLKNNLFITQKELAIIVDITGKSIKANIKKLQQNHIIRRIGADKNGYLEKINNK